LPFPYPGNIELKPTEVSATGSATSRLNKVFQAVTSGKGIEAGVSDITTGVNSSLRFLSLGYRNLYRLAWAKFEPGDYATNNNYDYQENSNQRPKSVKLTCCNGRPPSARYLDELLHLPFG